MVAGLGLSSGRWVLEVLEIKPSLGAGVPLTLNPKP